MPGFPFLDLINEDPRLAYYSQLYSQGLNPLQTQHFQGQYGDIYNQYLGQLGQGLVSAQQRGLGLADYLAQPQQSFFEYLQQNPFTQRFAKIPPSLRAGGGASRFVPPTRWVV